MKINKRRSHADEMSLANGLDEYNGRCVQCESDVIYYAARPQRPADIVCSATCDQAHYETLYGHTAN
jgi:hypothetical protein